jgi:alanine dehydrogenase
VIVGVPKEVKNHEYRGPRLPEASESSCTPAHQVVVETTAARARRYRCRLRGRRCEDPPECRRRLRRSRSDNQGERAATHRGERFKEGHALFNYLHLAVHEGLTRFLMERKMRTMTGS